mmetsp:Transcript_31637/g.73851  ORF Transcript_31637/g.73851 Transcript_31637/m.73851 type:complete len:761 (+) Transcript_31637:84-2366(+)
MPMRGIFGDSNAWKLAGTLGAAAGVAAASVATASAVRWHLQERRNRRLRMSSFVMEAPGMDEDLTSLSGSDDGGQVYARTQASQASSSTAPVLAGREAVQPIASGAEVGLATDEGAAGGAASPDARDGPMRINTVLAALQACDKVNVESIWGPFQMNGADESPVICFQFRMSHFTCKAYLAYGTQEEGSQHLKLQTVFEDNRRSLGEEQRYFIANEWNATKRYTRLKCGSGAGPRGSVFNLEYDVLLPLDLPHSAGLLLVVQTLRMWYTSMVACVMHIVADRELPFATHAMIQANTLTVTVQDEASSLLQQTCPICLEQFKPGEKVRRLPCMHLFHVVAADSKACQGRHCNIDRHLVCDKHCPVCKTPIDVMEQMERNNAKTTSAGVETEGGAVSVPVAGDGDSLTRTLPASDPVAQTDGAAADLALPISDQAIRDQDAALQAPMQAPAGEGVDTGIISEGGTTVAVVSNTNETRIDPRLPAQAAELERAVRSLQTRWLQIQDFVSGMQQMLHYIEERQSLVQQTRDQWNAPVGQQETSAAQDTASNGAPLQQTVGDGAGTVNQALLEEGEQHAVAAAQMEDVNQIEAGDYDTPVIESRSDLAAGPEPTSRLIPASREMLLTAAAALANPPATGNAASSSLSVVQPGPADLRSTAASGPADVSAAATVPRADPPGVRHDLLMPPVEAPAQQRGVGLQPPRSEAGGLSNAPVAAAPSAQWQPYSEGEKDCMAKMWRKRRAEQKTSNSSGGSGPSPQRRSAP